LSVLDFSGLVRNDGCRVEGRPNRRRSVRLVQVLVVRTRRVHPARSGVLLLVRTPPRHEHHPFDVHRFALRDCQFQHHLRDRRHRRDVSLNSPLPLMTPTCRVFFVVVALLMIASTIYDALCQNFNTGETKPTQRSGTDRYGSAVPPALALLFGTLQRQEAPADQHQHHRTDPVLQRDALHQHDVGGGVPRRLSLPSGGGGSRELPRSGRVGPDLDGALHPLGAARRRHVFLHLGVPPGLQLSQIRPRPESCRAAD
jgi:hypothetical protein